MIPASLPFASLRLHPFHSVSLALLFAVSARAGATPLPITVDGLYDDWSGETPAHSDPAGDDGTSGIDFGRLWIADDARFLFLRLETGLEVQLDENNSMVLYLDTDNNASTGLAVAGIGAELEWKLGLRTGTYYRSGNSWTVAQDDLRFRSVPTVAANDYEIAFGRDTLPNGSNPLFFGTTVKVVIKDTAGSGDQLPNSGQFVTYVMDQGAAPSTTAIPFGRELTSDLRIATQNSHNDSPWNASLQPKFRRLYQATVPDIFNFQEIYNHTPDETRGLIVSWLGGTWYAADNNDCQVVSRYPIDGSWAVDGNLAVLVNTSSVLGNKLLIVNTHLPCCTDESGRQAEVDHILSFLRDAKNEPGGQLDIPANTAILFTGDMNLVGEAQPLRSLLQGNIIDETTWGSDFAPDWDGTSLTDLVSRQTQKRMAYTWRSDTSSFWPGRLDFFLYSDAVLEARNHYLVYTREMSADSLAAHSLQSADSDASDHLLQIGDFRSVASDSGTPGDDTPERGGLELRIAPNPARGFAELEFELAAPGTVEISIFDSAGRRVASPHSGRVDAGASSISWEPRSDLGTRLAPGLYFARLEVSYVGGHHADATRALTVLP